MAQMADPMNALLSLQVEIDSGRFLHLNPKPCALTVDYQVILDSPNGQTRFSYAKIVSDELLVLSMFAMAQPIGKVTCFNIGYAVSTKYRGRGLGLEAVKQGIRELVHGFSRTQLKKFYIEAVIENSNGPSINIANKIFGNPGKPTVDAFSGRNALAFQKLIIIS